MKKIISILIISLLATINYGQSLYPWGSVTGKGISKGLFEPDSGIKFLPKVLRPFRYTGDSTCMLAVDNNKQLSYTKDGITWNAILNSSNQTYLWKPNYFFHARTKNPVIPYSPGALTNGGSQYNPSAIRYHGVIYVYTKADVLRNISIDSSTDNGNTFFFLDTPITRSYTHQWDSIQTSDPCAFYDTFGTGQVYVLYKGIENANAGRMDIGLATGNDPSHLTKYAGNPVITQQQLIAAGWTQGMYDLSPVSVIKYKGSWYLYVSFRDSATLTYRIGLLTTTDFHSFTPLKVIVIPLAPYAEYCKMSVYRLSDSNYYASIDARSPGSQIKTMWAKDPTDTWYDMDGSELQTNGDTSSYCTQRMYADCWLYANDNTFTTLDTSGGGKAQHYVSGSSLTVNGNRRDRVGLVRVTLYDYRNSYDDSIQHTVRTDLKSYMNAELYFTYNSVITMDDGMLATVTNGQGDILVRQNQSPRHMATATNLSIFKILAMDRPPLGSLGGDTLLTMHNGTVRGINTSDSFRIPANIVSNKNIVTQGTQSGIRSVSINTTTTVNDHTLLVDASTGDITITLTGTTNTVSSATCGNTLYIKKKAGGNNVILSPASGNIDGGATLTISVLYDSMEVQWDGSNWWRIN